MTDERTEAERTPPPEPGLYYDVPEPEYRAWDAINWSNLKLMAKTPRHYHHAATREPFDSTDAQDQGRLFHSLLLEPDIAKDMFVVRPQTYPSESSKGRGENKVTDTVEKPWNMNANYCKAWVKRQADEGKIVVRPYDLNAARAMTASIMEIPDAVVFLKGAQTEVSIVWDDPQTGLRCKGRLDILNHGQIGDAKSSSGSLARDEFARTVKYWGYAGQAAFYRDGLDVLLNNDGVPLPTVPMFRFFCAESNPPFAAAIYDLYDKPGSVSHDWFVYGRNLYHSYLQQVAYAIKHGQWATWNQLDITRPPEANELVIPDWMKLEGDLQ